MRGIVLLTFALMALTMMQHSLFSQDEQPQDKSQLGEAELFASIDSLKEAAEQGDAESQYVLASFYQYGTNITQNYAEAIKWYRRAADQGHEQAQISLGFMYSGSEGVPQDYEPPRICCKVLCLSQWKIRRQT